MLFLFKMVTCQHFDQSKAYNQKIITVGLVESKSLLTYLLLQKYQIHKSDLLLFNFF